MKITFPYSLYGTPVWVAEFIGTVDMKMCDITLGTDIGFRLNTQTKTYELVTDIQTWNHPTPPKRMVEKITQEYAIELIAREVKRKGFEIESQKKDVENNVEIVATRWV